MVGVARRTSLPRCAFAGNFPRHRGGLNSFEGRSSTAYTASRVQCSLSVCLSSLDAQGGRETACLPRPQGTNTFALGPSHSAFYSPSPPLAQAYRGDVLSCIADMDMHTGCGELAFCPALGLLAVVTVARGELLTLSTSHKYQTTPSKPLDGCKEQLPAHSTQTGAPACGISNNERSLASAPASPESYQQPRTQVRPHVQHLRCCFCSASTTAGHVRSAQARRRPDIRGSS
jgi:hypothetical protein